MKQPYLIASYPKSGNTWLKFILANYFYPDIEHDFASVNYHIPELGLDTIHLKEGIKSPKFYKTHYHHNGSNIIYLHRHVGDCLISHWWYNKQFHQDKRPIYEWIIELDYGVQWRDHVNFYFPQRIALSYEGLKNDTSGSVEFLLREIGENVDYLRIKEAIDKSSFENMQKAEAKGYGLYESAIIDHNIKFVRKGQINQWSELDKDVQDKILDKNYRELRILGYV